MELELRRSPLATLESELRERERALDATKVDLQALQARYLTEIGPLYAELGEVDRAVIEREVALGLRSPEPPESDDAPDAGARVIEPAPRSTPSPELKRMFRDLAKTLHPDLVVDEAAKYRRHSLMAEATRAYAEQDEDRLRLILHAWDRSPESVQGDDPEADRERTERRTREISQRLVAIEAERADLERSAIHRLKIKIDDARRQGWDLFAEMQRQVRREIARQRSRLASLG